MECTTVVLDHGYVRLIETWGSDSAIIEAARMSTQKGFQGWGSKQTCLKCGKVVQLPSDDPDSGGCQEKGEHSWDKPVPGDEKLLAYLYKHKHMTPFEMCGAIFEIKAPIFVFREWHRHRTQSYNEMSARYIPLPNENYSPEVHNLVGRSLAAANSANRQAGTQGVVLDLDTALADLLELEDYYQRGQALYNRFLAHGWPKELARLPVPVARYSAMRASANLRNWMQFLELRCAPQAQEEIRLYAKAVFAILELDFPRTMKLFRGNHDS